MSEGELQTESLLLDYHPRFPPKSLDSFLLGVIWSCESPATVSSSVVWCRLGWEAIRASESGEWLTGVEMQRSSHRVTAAGSFADTAFQKEQVRAFEHAFTNIRATVECPT